MLYVWRSNQKLSGKQMQGSKCGAEVSLKVGEAGRFLEYR